MNRIKVKICGIRTTEAAITAVNAGADFIGFNFVSSSKRYIHPDAAKAIADTVRGRVKLVGVFMDMPIEEVKAIIAYVGLEFAQLHGGEDTEYVRKVPVPVIKRIHMSDIKVNLYKVSARHFLLDRDVQGRGDVIPTQQAEGFAKSLSLFIAGGLTPENVQSAVSGIRPFAVDVAGGIETDGEQDAKKIRLFIKRAKEIVL